MILLHFEIYHFSKEVMKNKSLILKIYLEIVFLRKEVQINILHSWMCLFRAYKPCLSSDHITITTFDHLKFKHKIPLTRKNNFHLCSACFKVIVTHTLLIIVASIG